MLATLNKFLNSIVINYEEKPSYIIYKALYQVLIRIDRDRTLKNVDNDLQDKALKLCIKILDRLISDFYHNTYYRVKDSNGITVQVEDGLKVVNSRKLEDNKVNEYTVKKKNAMIKSRQMKNTLWRLINENIDHW